jgi:hypothetical protein
MDTPSSLLTPHPGDPPQPGRNEQPQGESGFVDGSGPLFSMYFKLAGEEDKKLTKSWTGDADGILVFVSYYCMFSTSTQINPEPEDWFILRHCRSICCRIRPGPQTKFPGHLSVLPRKHLSNPQWLRDRYTPLTFRSVHPIFSTNFCCLGQLTLVSQLGYQSHMRTFGNIAAAMGPSVHEYHPDTIRTTQTSTDSCVLCRGSRETSPPVGRRSVACIVTPFAFPLLRWPRRVPFQYQPYGFQGGHIVDWILYRGVHLYHIDANVST